MVKLSISWTICISTPTYGHDLCDRNKKKPSEFPGEDPVHNRVTMLPLEEVSSKKEVMVSLLRLLPPRTGPDDWKKLTEWMEGDFVFAAVNLSVCLVLSKIT